MQQLKQILPQLGWRQPPSRRWLRYWLSRTLLLGMLLAIAIRSLPYLVPIRAAALVPDSQAVEFSDRHGLWLGRVLSRDQDHTAVVPLEQVSPQFIQAILAAEDGRFYQHGPLDLQALVRAIAEAIQARQIVSGASTITMQLARMTHPTPRTLAGKLQEVWRSWRLAAGMSRDQILQSYLNRLPMGGNVYGVEAAAQVYFGIPARDLSLAQASLLAALPNDPTDLHPYSHWPALKQRQRYVLDQMVADGYITAAEADRVQAEAIELRPPQQGIVAAPHFLFWLASQLPAEHPSRIQTTIDLRLQQFVEAQVRQNIAALAGHQVDQAGALVIDNRSGDVLTYVGSTDYFSEAEMGRNDAVQALRQPGSTLKPFLYELALEQRLIRPNTVLADVPTYYPIPGAKLYSPTDYSKTFQGPVRVRVALANSLNIPAVRVLEQVGVSAFLDRLHHLGFAHLTHSPDYYGLGLALGSGEVSLWELAHAYAVIANQGQALELRGWRGKEKGREGEGGLPQFPATWALITDMLSDRHARAKAFGVESVLNLPFAAAVKTGTSSDFRDTWTVGFTSRYTVATWVGNFDGQPMRQVSGVMGAAPLWSRIMLHLHEHQEPAAFPAPAGLVKRPICALSGFRPMPACPSVVQEYFYPEDLSAYEQRSDPFYQSIADSREPSPQYRLNLPPEYNEWLAMQPPTASSTLKIVSPRNGDYFLIAEPAADSVSTTSQRLEFKLAGPVDEPVEWWLNGTKLASPSSSSLFWPLRPGSWTLEIKSGDRTDQVQFQVGVGEPRSHRRGFSLAEP